MRGSTGVEVNMDDPSQPDAQPFPELLEPLLAAYEECLTPNERRQVQF